METAIEDLITAEEASKITSLPVKNLQARRAAKLPPSYVQLGRLIRYRKSDLEKFLQSCIVDTQGSVVETSNN